jgi:AraC family transcriptional regulator
MPDHPSINTQQPLRSRWMPKTSSACSIEAQLTRPTFQVEVRRDFWDTPLEPTEFILDICYLQVSLKPRSSEPEVDYFGDQVSPAFFPTGKCSFVPAGHKAKIRNLEGEQYVAACFFDMSVFEPYIKWQWTPLHLAACFDIYNINVTHTLALLSQEASHPGFNSDELADALFNCLMIELSRHIQDVTGSINKQQNTLSPQKLRIINSCIHNAKGAYPSVPQLAKKCGMSDRHMARLFKASTGKTIQAYIFDAQVSRAKLLLADDMQIKEIAFECGYKSASAFSHAFKQATGLTPKQYRNQSSAQFL